MLNNKMIIYQCYNKNNAKTYIGQTSKTLEIRKKKHIYDMKRYNYYFLRALRKYGIDNFQWSILKECKSKEEMDKWENYYIKLLHTNEREYGYNMTDGGDGIIGLKFTEDHKKKISEASKKHKHSKETRKKISSFHKSLIGEKNSFFGKHHSIESINKISLSKKGTKLSKEHRKKISLSLLGNKRTLGKKLSEEHKQKISKGCTGRTWKMSEQAKFNMKNAWIKRKQNTNKKVLF